MAIAKFHSFRGEKSALILVKANKFVLAYQCVYVPKDACKDMVAEQEFTIPDGFTLVDMTNEDGSIRTTNEGQPLKMLQY